MSRGCPSDEEWVRYVDGEVTANRGDALEAHTDDCSRCRRQVEELRALTGDIATPVAAPDADAVAQVMRKVARGASADAAAARSPRRPLLVFAGAAGLAAAAAVVLLMTRASPDEAFQARGGPSIASLRRNVGLSLYANGRALQQRAAVGPETTYRLGYTNLFQDPRDRVYLLLFAVDSAGEVHWLFPGFTDPSSDPAAIALAATASEALLPETVVLDGPRPGPLRIVAILSAAPLSVSAIEALNAEQLSVPALEARWPDAEIRELAASVQP